MAKKEIKKDENIEEVKSAEVKKDIPVEEIKVVAEEVAVAAEELVFSDADLQILRQAGAEFFAAAIDAIKQGSNISFKELADFVKERTGAKGKELFMPLRIALTGQSHGPELAKLITFMSSELIINRFEHVRTNNLQYEEPAKRSF